LANHKQELHMTVILVVWSAWSWKLCTGYHIHHSCKL